MLINDYNNVWSLLLVLIEYIISSVSLTLFFSLIFTQKLLAIKSNVLTTASVLVIIRIVYFYVQNLSRGTPSAKFNI